MAHFCGKYSTLAHSMENKARFMLLILYGFIKLISIDGLFAHNNIITP